MKSRRDIKFALATIILFTCIVFVYKHILFTNENVPTSNNEFPSRILDWAGDEVAYDKDTLSSLSMDKTVYKTYHRDEYPPITLFLAYYNTLEKADRSHSPIVCFTGQGWKIINTDKIEIPINLPHTDKITVNRIVEKKLDNKLIVLYWYQSAIHASSNRGIQKLSLFFHKLLGRPDNNAFVRVTANITEGKSIEDATSYLSIFVRDLYPELRRFFIEGRRQNDRIES